MSTEPNTPVNHEEMAQALMLKIRELTQSVEGFTFAAKGRRRKITTSASAPDAFLEAVAVACDASPHLGASDQLTAAVLRECITFSRAYTSVANELLVVARGFLDTVAERRNDISKRARRVYSMAKSINGPEERELLIPHLANMQRTLGRGRPAKRPVAKPVPPVSPVAPAPGVATPAVPAPAVPAPIVPTPTPAQAASTPPVPAQPQSGGAS